MRSGDSGAIYPAADGCRPEVSVILPARDAADTLGEQLEALAEQTYQGRWELIVVDNRSRDETADVAESWRTKMPHLRIVRAPLARNVAGVRNAGVRASRGDLLLFCDADDVVNREWIAQLAGGLRDVPAVAGAIERCRLNGPEQLSWRPNRPMDGLPNHFRYLPHGQGANFGVRKQVLCAIGGFDEEFGRSEDIVFFWRIQLAGYEVAFIPGAIVYYRYRASLLATVRQNFSYGKSHAQLYRCFAPAGMPGSGAAALQEWGWVISHAPLAVCSQSTRGAWLAKTARCIGRLIGSLQYRTFYP